MADSIGCTLQNVVTITQPPQITLTLTASSPSICAGGGVVLTATASGGAGSSFTYSWSTGTNFSVTIGNQALAGTHVYTAVAIDANNCTGSNTISINYISNPPLTALLNQTICAGQSATLSASGASGYTWQPSGANTNSIVVSPTVPITIYTLSATNNTCGITSTVSVNYYDYPVLNVSPNQTICSNQSATLNASGASVFTWQPNSIVSNSIVVSPTVPITIYTVTATNNICATSETVQVSFYSNPTLTVTPTQSICPTFTANLTVSGANTYTWLPNNTVSNAITVSPPSTSIYSVTGTGIGGCQSTETTQVFVFPLPTFTFNTYTITCANLGSATVTPSGGYGAYNYTWQPTNQNGAVAVGLNPNTYTVTAYDIGTGCYKDSIVTFSSLIPLTGNLHNQNTLKCNSVNTGTAYFTNLSGGSGNENYFWNNGVTTHTNASPNNLSAGNWSVTVADALTGCQIYSVFTITQPPALTLNVASTDLNICTGYNFTLSANASGGVGAYSYSWLSAPASGSQFTVTPNNAGIHTFTANAYDYNNCFISNTINVNVVSPPSLTISLSSPSMCAQAFSGSANTITLTSSGANSYTLQTPNQIANSSSVNPVSELNSQPPHQPTGATTATLYGSNGVCTVSTTANFSVIPNPTVTVNSTTPVICAGQSYTYTSQGASSYTWTSATPNSTLYTYGNIAVTNPSINSVFAVVGGSLGCYSPIVTTSITVNPIPEVYVSPTQTYVCLGKSVQLNASGTNGNTYSWLPNKDLDQSTGNSVFASPQTQQNYTVIASLNNCTNAAVATVSIKPLPNPQIQLIKNGKCVNDSIVLKGSGGMAYQWIAPNGQTLWGFEELRIIANHESFSGTYTLMVYDFYSCANSKTQSVTINPLPNGNITTQRFEGCVPLCNDFSFASQSSITAITWQVQNKKFSANKLNYCFNQAGTHTIQANVRDENSCANSIVTQVIVYPQPIADFSYTPTQPIESLDEVQFINTSKNAEKFEWNISVINQTSQEKNTSALFENTGTYVVALTAQNEKQCLDTAIKSIYVLPDFTIFVPNIFTPNGDNLNETFKPVVRGQKEYRFQIFNRWGQKIFETTDINQGWDGTFRGELAKADSYVWKITVVSAKEEKVLNGTVNLER
ncbi:MAG: gliding motility-associated C-terminal domain-containing protein [Bacteroidetes bacterium]|nr:gliding motility-associated C-terminal domain-containing protein [Bacteroidota bacterium]